MRLFFQNPKNEWLESKNLQISPEYTHGETALVTVLYILLFPVMLIVYPIGKLLLGAFNLAGQTAFYLTDTIRGKLPHDKPYRWQGVRAYISHTMAAGVPHINVRYRKFLYRLTGMRIGKNVFVGQGGMLEDLYSQNIAIEDGAAISFGVTVIGHGPKRNLPAERQTVILRKGSYVGAASVLIPGVEIGEYATVGSGSVVTKDIPAGAVAAGDPARVLYFKPGWGPEGRIPVEKTDAD